MRISNPKFNSYVSSFVRMIRLRRHFTQEKMAELLNISARCYQTLESGCCGAGGRTICLLLLMLSEEERNEFICC